MKNRHVRFTATAKEHVRREKAWWWANRDHPDVFTEELEQALRSSRRFQVPEPSTLSLQFPAFAASTSGELPSILYYTFDGAGVIVRALWGARRERGPRI